MNVHSGELYVNDAESGGKPARPKAGYLRLSGELAASYGMSYRQLWRKVRENPEKFGAFQDEESRHWYLPAGADVARERAAITPEVEERIKDALSKDRKAASIAHREQVSESLVYKIRERYLEALTKEDRQRREQRKYIKENLPELTGIQMRGGTAISAIDFSRANRVHLDQLVKLGEDAYLDSIKHVLYVSQEKLKEIAKREDEQAARLGELYRSVAEHTEDKTPQDS